MPDRSLTPKTEAEVYKIALDASSIVAVTNPNGIIIDVNDKFCEISQYSRQELIGKNHRLVKSGLHPDSFFKDLWDTIKSGQVWYGEVCNKKKNGALYWVQTTIVPILTPSGEIQKFVSIRNEITEKKRKEEELALAKEQAENAAKARKMFLANMSHEIRTPLNAIVGIADLLLETSLSEEQKKYVETYRQAGENLLALVNDILDFSKIDSGKFEFRPVWADISQLLQEQISLYTFAANNKGISLALNNHISFNYEVYASVKAIQHILVNLIGNAIKFTPPGGKVSVNSFLKNPLIKRSAEIVIEIIDTGIGIPANKLDLIFDAFQQADNSLTKKYSGTGLGLAISYKLAVQMNGQLTVESELGKGTKFVITIPCLAKEKNLDPTAIQTAESTAETLAANTSMVHKILVADDVADNRMIVEKFLQNEPFQLTFVENGLQAVEIFKKESFDLVLMDIQMPELDGISAVEEIRKWEQSKTNEKSKGAVPIIALTGYSMHDEVERFLKIGFNDHLSKPIRKAMLVKIVKKFLTQDSTDLIIKSHIKPA